MNFLRVVLFPFAVLYDFATRVRNYLFNIGYKRAFEFETCVIAIGNLSVGGTGKTPMVEYLIRLLQDKYKVTTLSRGYGRKTKGFRLASTDDTYLTIGDEPVQFCKKFENINVSVGEERAVAIPFILAERPETQVILLDDAYQHRTVKPNCNILLTDYNRPFFEDYVLPAGRLREARNGAGRADVIILTKCPETITNQEKALIIDQIRKYNSCPVFFSAVKYLKPMLVFKNDNFSNNVFLFSGIANSMNLQQFVAGRYNLIGEKHFGDHHQYTVNDIDAIFEAFDQIPLDSKCLLTTEKDMVKLMTGKIQEKLEDRPVFYLPIETYFLEGGKQFDDIVSNTVSNLF